MTVTILIYELPPLTTSPELEIHYQSCSIIKIVKYLQFDSAANFEQLGNGCSTDTQSPSELAPYGGLRIEKAIITK